MNGGKLSDNNSEIFNSYSGETKIPTRVPKLTRQGAPYWLGEIFPRPISKLLEPLCVLGKAQHQEMISGLWEGDEPVDRVVEWMFEVSPGDAKNQFDKALNQGISNIKDPDPRLSDFFKLVDSPPDWVDRIS